MVEYKHKKNTQKMDLKMTKFKFKIRCHFSKIPLKEGGKDLDASDRSDRGGLMMPLLRYCSAHSLIS